MLPVALELAAEVVWGVEGAGAEWTSAVLYWGGNGECESVRLGEGAS